jgi:hypothetical protein
MRMIFLLSLCYFIHGGSLLAQLKMEREYRINKKEVPLVARQLIDSCFGKQKVRWYAEQALADKTFEAKIKIKKQGFKKQRFSIEFDSLGRVQDVELQIKLNQIPARLQTQILAALGSRFNKYKIVKIQEQWVGSREALFYKAKGLPSPLPVVVNYEFVVIGRRDKVYKSFELLFAPDGQILSSLEVIHSSNDNLIY